MIKICESKNIVIFCIISFILICPFSSINTCAFQKTNSHEIFTNGYKINSEDALQVVINMLLEVNEQTLYDHVEIIQGFGPHPTGSEACDLVGEYIFDELESYGLSVEYEPWSFDKYSGDNIEATIQGIGKTDGIVIICAHYDSVDVSPGAEDDGSGVSSLLEIARIMSNNSYNSTVKFVFFSGEEQGTYGSRIYAKNSRENNENIRGVLCLDGVGFAITEEDGNLMRHYANDQSSWMVDLSQEIADSYFDYIGLEVLQLPHFAASDHRSFVQEGFAGSFVNKYRMNPNRHTSEDRIEYMNFSYLSKICKLSLGTFFKMANLNSELTEEDIKISMKGTILSRPAQLCVRIENKNYELDTANLTIQIKFTNLLQDLYDKFFEEPILVFNNWTFNKEVEEYWEFKTSSKQYLHQIFRLDVTVKGYNDDIGLYKQEQTYGVIIHPFVVFLIPKF